MRLRGVQQDQKCQEGVECVQHASLQPPRAFAFETLTEEVRSTTLFGQFELVGPTPLKKKFEKKLEHKTSAGLPRIIQPT
jgi:hypothetical protein